jgi:hypothetical protein
MFPLAMQQHSTAGLGGRGSLMTVRTKPWHRHGDAVTAFVMLSSGVVAPPLYV